ncbi:FK506-binding protein 2 [Scheffersomyces coipomensis]|uniref:FK506-binding protein 2 n=1 Tax=Scheffersomyces coipomensis TaxID=1788519 RepID=UPI00315DE111
MKVTSVVASTAILVSQLFGLTNAAIEGLQIETLVAVPPKECYATAESGDLISVHYTGTLDDGTVFDSSYPRGQPIVFQLGVGQVIPGWDQGLIGMCVGEKRKLVIAPELAYGDNAIGPIPAKSTLTFESELIHIAGKDPVEEESVPDLEEDDEEAIEEEEEEEEEEVHDEL